MPGSGWWHVWWVGDTGAQVIDPFGCCYKRSVSCLNIFVSIGCSAGMAHIETRACHVFALDRMAKRRNSDVTLSTCRTAHLG